MSLRQEVLDTITTLPGATFSQIFDLHPGRAQGAVSAAIQECVIRGDIVRELIPNPAPKPTKANSKKGWRSQVYAYSPNPDPKKTPQVIQKRSYNRKKKAEGPTAVGYAARIEELQQKVVDLETWKAKAIERFPTLAVHPLMLQARQIVASEVADSDPVLAKHIREGHKDDILPVRVLFKTLESMA
jgi:hypothetical protein